MNCTEDLKFLKKQTRLVYAVRQATIIGNSTKLKATQVTQSSFVDWVAFFLYLCIYGFDAYVNFLAFNEQNKELSYKYIRMDEN